MCDMRDLAHSSDLWALILAGGDGVRLRALTRHLVGDERPKQFCALLGQRTLLDQTRDRVRLAVPTERTLLVLSRSHARFYDPLIADTPTRCRVVQPANRGTAVAVLYGLRRIAMEAATATVAIFASDHYVSDDARFMQHVRAAAAAALTCPDLVVLLGITPDAPESDYGWIEPGATLPIDALRRVRRFWEKPAPAVATRLLADDGLWNSFVIVARVPILIAMIADALPALARGFDGLGAILGTLAEPAAVRRLYAALRPVDFSQRILMPAPANLAVLPVRGVTWSDWGRPSRVLATLRALGVAPSWIARLGASRERALAGE